MAKAALPHLKRGASIINSGSITGLEGSKELLDYSATKGAIHAFTKSLAQNLVERRHPRQLRRARPGLDAAQPGGQGGRRTWPSSARTRPTKRPAQPEEIAPAFVFFASEADSSYITGEVLTLLGGETTAG